MTDTIAAIATAPAKSAIGIIRIDGSGASDVADKIFKSKKSIIKNPRVMCYGDMLDKQGDIIDRGLAVFFPSPNSYTGENMTELYCHGSLTVLRTVLDAAYNAGARPAKPGEFTKRAFLNGKLDLTQAEAVIDLIDSETKNAAKNAAAQIEGVIGDKIFSVRDRLLDIMSEFYAYVDYPDEEIEQQSRDVIIKTLNDAAQDLSELSDSFEQGRLLRDGVKCAIIGRPNVGKSSILNAILGFERSIVTELAGTTRDTIEETVTLGGLILRLIDTAGLRHTSDLIEKLGVTRSENAAINADLILAVFDGSEPLTDEDKSVMELLSGRLAVAVINKSDLKQEINIDTLSRVFEDRICFVSALDKSGFDGLTERIQACFDLNGIPCDGQTVTNPRHASALRRAAQLVKSAGDTLAAGHSPDIAVQDAEEAVNVLGELTGQTASEEVVKRVFERFCVGK